MIAPKKSIPTATGRSRNRLFPDQTSTFASYPGTYFNFNFTDIHSLFSRVEGPELGLLCVGVAPFDVDSRVDR